MNSFKGTPGPWFVRDKDIESVGNEAEMTALCYGTANANLIAAAPELLAALQLLIKGYEGYEESGMFDLLCHGDEIELANAAIKKALGKS